MNEELRGRLHELQIDVTAGAADGNSGNMMDEEIIELNGNLSNVKKDHQAIQEKFKRINIQKLKLISKVFGIIVNDQISGWARRCFNKFSQLVDNGKLNGIHQGSNQDIVRIFEGMNIVVVDELGRLLEKQATNDDGDHGIEYGDVFTDFATEDFISKNIRVRPVSGVTHVDDTKDGRQSNVSRAQQQQTHMLQSVLSDLLGPPLYNFIQQQQRDTEGNEDGEDNYNKYAQLELEDQRKLIKTKHRDALEEVKRRQLLAQKEAEAKKKQ